MTNMMRICCVAVICLGVCVRKTEATTCKIIQANDPDSPSGDYELPGIEDGQEVEVYCEMGLGGGGFTFINSKDLATLRDDHLQSMFTDKTTFLLRLKDCIGAQNYIILKQLPQYADIPLRIALNGDTNYAKPQNAQLIGHPYLYFGFLPIANASNGNTQGVLANGVEQTFTNCDSNPNSYIALFPNYKEIPPTNYSLGVDFPFINQILSASIPNPSGREMPMRYYYFMEAHFGGCGGYTQTDSRLRSSQACIISAAIGFR